MEFPSIHFTLTDIIAGGYPNYHRAMNFAWKNGVNNISSSVWNTLEPTAHRFDLVASTEMLEHIRDAKKAVANMRAASRKYIYCLVPFADAHTNANLKLREKVWEQNEHFVYGYDVDAMRDLFGKSGKVRSAYTPVGVAFRERLSKMSDTEIAQDFDELCRAANADIVNSGKPPSTLKDALGIRILAEVIDEVAQNPRLPFTLERLRERLTGSREPAKAA
jgi:hypothetical protein